VKRKISLILLIILVLISIGYRPNAEELEEQALKAEQEAVSNKINTMMQLLK